MVSFVNVNLKRWHLWEIDSRFALTRLQGGKACLASTRTAAFSERKRPWSPCIGEVVL